MVCRADNRRAVVVGLFAMIIACFSSFSASFGQTSPGQAPSSVQASQQVLPGQAPQQMLSGQAEKIAVSSITYKIIGSDGEGFGYDIFADGKMVIHQPGIPGQPGINGFRTKADSEKVAQLVVRKLKNKEMPPTVSEEELRTLKVIN